MGDPSNAGDDFEMGVDTPLRTMDLRAMCVLPSAITNTIPIFSTVIFTIQKECHQTLMKKSL